LPTPDALDSSAVVATDGLPGSMLAMAIMLMVHGFFLDVLVIGVVPFFSEAAAAASRKALFPWCLGGYSGFGEGDARSRDDPVPNLGPAHRRFMSENAAYACLRGGAGLYVIYSGSLAMPALTMAVISHFLEALSIAWEIFKYNAPVDAAPPMTLMGIFSTWTLLTVMNNSGSYLAIDDVSLVVMKVFVGLTWTAWLWGVVGVIKLKRSGVGKSMQ